MVSEQQDKYKETNHPKEVLHRNGYKPWMFKIPKKKKRKNLRVPTENPRP